MFLFIQAIKNISRNRNKYILYGAFVFLIIYICVTLVILLQNLNATLEHLDRNMTEEYIPIYQVLINKRSALNFTLWAILSVTGLIIIYISIILIHERKYDIGVMMSMGMNKLKIVLYVAYEITVFIISTAFTSSCFAILLSFYTAQYYDSTLHKTQKLLEIDFSISI